MRRLLAVIALAAVAVGGRADDKPAWKEFTSKEGRFKVLMPATPRQSDHDTESDFGKGVLHMNTARVGDMMYGANYCDFPPTVRDIPIKAFLDASRDGAIANLEGKLVSEKDVRLGKYPGREIRIDVGAGRSLFRVRVFLVEQRLYQAVVFGTHEAATSKEADRFLDSFQLINK